MKRIIKFRAWNKEHKQMWFDGGHIDLSIRLEGRLWTPDSYYGVNQTENFVLMQFTGILDKNGVQIYEGDIIEYDYGNPLKREIPNPKKREIAFIDGAFVLKNDDHYYNQPLNTNLSQRNKNCEVIGNIYQHPELLNKDI